MITSIYSNAFNFPDAVQTMVDPRTGFYASFLSLIQLNTNNLNGVVFQLGLSYSPLNAENVGFGIGWSIAGLSYYDRINKTLNVSTGENFKVHEVGNQLLLRDLKIPSFKFELREDGYYQVTHKSGFVEILSHRDDAYNTKVVTSMIAPNGKELNFTWNSSVSMRQLISIQDETQTWCTIEYKGKSSTRVTCFPSSEVEKVANMHFTNDLLTTFEWDFEDQSPTWTFGYTNVGGLTVLTNSANPIGLRENVVYKADGHKLPTGAPFAALPCVIAWTRYPQCDQPSIQLTYRFSDNNFLGYNSQFNWNEDQDNLYQAAHDYTYFSVVTRTLSNGIQETTKRTYNKFHLLSTEEVNCNDKQLTTKIDYYANPVTPFTDQPAQCQCPHTVAITHLDINTGKTSTEISYYEYDEWGNLTKQVDSTGVTIISEYYNEKGEEGCPADQFGFRQHLKSETTIPADSAYDTAKRVVQHAYQILKDSNMIVSKQFQNFTGSSLILQDEYSYIDDISSIDYGRVKLVNQTIDEFATSKVYNYQYADNQITVTELTAGFDQTTATKSITYCIYTGNVLLEQDAQLVKTTYKYDQLGRLKNKTVSEGTKFEVANKYKYCFAGEDAPAQIIATDIQENNRRTTYDGLGRLVQIEYQNVDQASISLADAPYYITQIGAYDEWGRLESVQQLDRNPPDQEFVKDFIRYEYDEWDQRCATIYHTDKASYRVIQATDPITLTITSGVEREGYTITKQDLFGNPIENSYYHRDGTLEAKMSYEYDGYGRKCKMIDPVGAITEYTYDECNRTEQVTLSDKTIVKMDYAKHSSTALATSIIAQGVQIGHRSFDGLHRITQKVVGGRTTTYQYEGACTYPSTVSTPVGDVIVYKNEPNLANALLNLSVEASRSSATIQENVFTYDPKTSQMLTASNLQDKLVQSWTYTPSGRIKTKTFQWADGSQKSNSYQFSFAGRLTQYTDILNVLQSYQYDAWGRLQNVEDQDLKTTVTYENADRIQSIKTTHIPTQAVHITSLTYDDFERETGYSFALNDEKPYLIISQTYNSTNRLATRQAVDSDNNILRDEIFTYDSRYRLTDYACNGIQFPKDAYVQAIQSQHFTLDALDNLTQVITIFEGGEDIATYHYENSNDPSQVTRITHTDTIHYPSEIPLQYDSNGCLVKDELGRNLTYNALDYLTEIYDSSGTLLANYTYDAFNNLVTQEMADGTICDFYYQQGRLANQIIRNTNEQKRYINLAGVGTIGEIHTGSNSKACLMGLNENGGILSSVDAQTLQITRFIYTPYGYQTTFQETGRESSENAAIGFNGEWQDPLTNNLLLGQYRFYSPVTLCFLKADSETPFGRGRLNSYAWPNRDPINLADPSGHGIIDALVDIGEFCARTARYIAKGVERGALTIGKGVAKGVRKRPLPTATFISAAIENTAKLAGDLATDPTAKKVLDNVAHVFGLIASILGMATLGKYIHDRRTKRGSYTLTSYKAKTENVTLISVTPEEQVLLLREQTENLEDHGAISTIRDTVSEVQLENARTPHGEHRDKITVEPEPLVEPGRRGSSGSQQGSHDSQQTPKKMEKKTKQRRSIDTEKEGAKSSEERLSADLVKHQQKENEDKEKHEVFLKALDDSEKKKSDLYQVSC